jgi:RHS repeat-associated protein
MNGKPSSAPLDSPLFGQIDEAGDGTFERSFYLIQNTLGDVIKIVEAGGQHEELRYTLYGEPYIVNWMADINQDGAVDGEDLISFFALWDVGAFGSDTNGDGGVDGDDVIQFLAWWDNGEGAGRTLADNRFGFRGYVWDDHLKLYHVRHRVYDPTPGPAGMRWLQRDPAFFVDGLNLYAYCGGDPVNCFDPMGLESWLIGTMFRSIGLPTIGEYADDTVDGAAELGSYWYNVDSVDDVLTDASDSEARQEVHDALQTAKEAASYVPVAGDLAGHAVNIVDKGLGVWDEYLDGPDPNACGMLPGGGSVFTPAVDELLQAIVGGVADRSKGKKPDAGKKSAVGEGPKKPHGNTANDAPAELYKKYDPKTGEFKKWGVAANSKKRYSQKKLAGDEVDPVARGPRKKMLEMERDLVETRPGPENREPWAGKRLGEEPRWRPPT